MGVTVTVSLYNVLVILLQVLLIRVLIEFMQDRPFFLMMAYDEVHVPLFASGKYLNTVRAPSLFFLSSFSFVISFSCF